MQTEALTLERRVTLAAELLASVSPRELRDLSNDQACAIVVDAERVGRSVDLIRGVAASEVVARSRRDLGEQSLAQRAGLTRGEHLVEQLTGASASEVARRVRLGDLAGPELLFDGSEGPGRTPVLRQAIVDREVDADAALAISRSIEGVRRTAAFDDLEAAETALVDFARTNSADTVAAFGRALRDRLDPDGVLPREEETRIRRGLRLGRERNGVTPIGGALDPVTAALLRSAFDEANAPGATPRFLSEADRRDGTQTLVDESGEEHVTVRDIRTREQRQHDVFGALLRAGVRETSSETAATRSTAEIVAVINLSDLQSGTGAGWLLGIDEPVSALTVQQLACDSAQRRIILGDEGEVIALGRSRYPFSPAQRKAIAIRDGGCVWPGCTAPVSWCDIHHAKPFTADGGTGTTDVGNGVLLCGEHHTLVHRSEWKLRMHHGIPQIQAPPSIDPSLTWRSVTRSPFRRRDLAHPTFPEPVALRQAQEPGPTMSGGISTGSMTGMVA